MDQKWVDFLPISQQDILFKNPHQFYLGRGDGVWKIYWNVSFESWNFGGKIQNILACASLSMF